MLYLLVTLAVAATPPASTLPAVEVLLALPGAPERIALLQQVMNSSSTTYDDAVRASAAVAVLRELERAHRTDAALVDGFLRAAMHADAASRDAAVAAATAGGLPPAIAAAPAPAPPGPQPPPPPPPADLTKLRQYKSQRLYKATTQAVTGSFTAYGGVGVGSVSTTSGWTVYQGSQAFSARDFATYTNDGLGLSRLSQQKRSQNTLAAALIGGGVATIGVSAAAVAAVPDAQYVAVPAMILSGPAIGFGIGIPLWRPSRNRWVASIYSQDEADRLIVKHNTALQKKLGLTDSDVREFELE